MSSLRGHYARLSKKRKTEADPAPATKAVVQRMVKSAISKNIPIKMHDYVGSPTTVTSTASIVCLTDISQGDDINNVTGRKALLKGLAYRFVTSANSTTGVSYTRVLILRDKNDVNDTAPTAAEILDQPSNFESALSRISIGRFQVLYDEILGNSTSGPYNQVRQGYLRVNKPMTFGGSGNFDGGHIFLLTISEAAVNGPGFQIYSRAYFTC